MTADKAKQERTDRLFGTIEHAEQVSLEAVRKFLDTVDGIFPHLSDDKPRRQIVDSAFEMTEQLVATSTRLAQNILDVTQKAQSELASSRKKATAPAKAAKKTTKSVKKTTKKATR